MIYTSTGSRWVNSFVLSNYTPRYGHVNADSILFSKRAKVDKPLSVLNRLGGHSRLTRSSGFNLRRDSFFRLFVFKLISAVTSPSVTILLNKDLAGCFTVQELVVIWTLSWRINQQFPIPSFGNAKMLERYKWRYGGLIAYSSVALRDPELINSWLVDRLPHVPLSQHRKFFRLLFSVIRGSVYTPTMGFSLLGVYLYLVGKISVTGNSMSRSMRSVAGKFCSSNINLRYTGSFSIVRTKTGCLGLTIRFFF